MTAWQPITQAPPAPGHYWTCIVTIVDTGDNGRRNVYYRDFGWQYYDGEAWTDTGFTHWYGEGGR